MEIKNGNVLILGKYATSIISFEKGFGSFLLKVKRICETIIKNLKFNPTFELCFNRV